MIAIKVQDLLKYYRVYQKESGLRGALESLVHRRYEDVKAVDGIHFEIAEGELVGFIGPNGAGKTTTLKCLSGILYPTAGQIFVLGFTPQERRGNFLRQISLIMGQRNQLWWDLPAQETFLLNKEIYGLSDKDYKASLFELVDLLEIKDLLKIQVRKLSLGQRMRCELAAALLHRPKVLFLDEPTIGLDVIMQKKVRDFIKSYRERHGATILLTSHYMGDVKELCQRIILIDRGKIAFDGPLSQIVKEHVSHKHVVITLFKETDQETLSAFGKIANFNFPQLILEIPKEETPAMVARILQKLAVRDLTVEEPPIEEIIRKLFAKGETFED